ncbi:MAG: beta-glucosidase [Spirochaetia bacterium]|nr:beta-glucosidase [Spirochaetia bacterium]
MAQVTRPPSALSSASSPTILLVPTVRGFLLGFVKRADFGPDFQWGTATAAYQIEGAWNVDGKGESIWDRFTHKKGTIARGETGDNACDHYHRYEEDIKLMSQLGMPNYRLSLAWSRIFPEGGGKLNQAGLDYYRRLLDTCVQNGIDPWVTLYHWDLPQKLEDKGGWPNRDTLDRFLEYVDFCTRTFASVKHWMILNEPVVFTGGGYYLGVHAPGKKSIGGFLPAVHHAALAQALGGGIVRKNAPHAEVGTTISTTFAYPASDKPRDLKATARFDAVMNRLFIDPAVGRGYPVDAMPLLKRIHKYFKAGDEESLTFNFDFWGIQNYTRGVVKFSLWPPVIWLKQVSPTKLAAQITDMGWEVYPDGLYGLLKKFGAYPEIKKLIVTESGCAFPDRLENGAVNDPNRVEYHRRYLDGVLRAKREGVNVQGYFAWSFMDNFEWAEGYRPRFGLVYVDYESQKRVPKQSALKFRDFLSGADW